MRKLVSAKKNTEYECGLCGTRLRLIDCGEGWVEEDLICCDVPMKAKAAKKKGKAKPKKKAKAKKRR